MFGQPKMRKIPLNINAKKKIIYAIVIVILVTVALISGRLRTKQEKSMLDSGADFQIHVIDVGQGDSIAVIADGHAMLVDAGLTESGSTVSRYLEKLGVTKLDYAVASHFHSDHIGGFPTVLEKFPVDTILEPNCADDLLPTSEVFVHYLDAVEASGAAYRTAEAGEVFTLGGAQVEVLAPAEAIGENLNNDSIVLRITYGDTSAILTGDMEHEEEQWLLEQGRELKSDFLKVAHHGSANGSGEEFLAAVQPEFVAISCGNGNEYGHPAQETLDRLKAHTNQIYVTMKCSSIAFLYEADTKRKYILNWNQVKVSDDEIQR